MKITLLSDEAIRLEPTAGPLTIEAPTADMQYSPFHMLASSLATCTFSVLYSWATHAKLEASDLTIEVRWEFAEEPHRVGTVEMVFSWPSLPPQRMKAAERVAALCPIHHTLTLPTTVSMRGAS